MPFFEPPPPDEPEPDDEPGVAGHARVVGGAVPLELLLARSDEAAVVVRGVVAYPDGFELRLVAHLRRPDRSCGPVLLDHFGGGQVSPEMLRFGIGFPDGRKATNLDAPGLDADPTHGLEPRGGGGDGLRMDQEFWAWPLPGPGTLTLACEWPAYGIPETTVDLDTALLREAAARAEPIWSDEAGLPTHHTRHTVFRQLRASAAAAEERDE